MTISRTTLSAATLVALLALTGCGSDSGSGTDTGTDPSASSSPSQSGGPGAGPGGGFDQDQLEEIQECLDAAGLEDVFPTDLPTDAPSDRPTDMPTDMPSDFDPENMPEGAPSGGPGGGGFAALQDPEVQSALEACGIEFPQRPTDAPS